MCFSKRQSDIFFYIIFILQLLRGWGWVAYDVKTVIQIEEGVIVMLDSTYIFIIRYTLEQHHNSVYLFYHLHF